MEMLKEQLWRLGYTDEEISVYATALSLGSVNALSVSRTTGIPRTTVYLLFESLVAKGLFMHRTAGEGEEKDRRAYDLCPPEYILRQAEARRHELQEVVTTVRHELPQLRALYDAGQGKPVMRYYETDVEILPVFRRLAQSGSLLLISLHEPHDGSAVHRVVGDVRHEMTDALCSGREIVLDVQGNYPYVAQTSSGRHEIRFLPRESHAPTVSIVSDTSVCHIVPRPSGGISLLHIDSPPLALSETIRFGYLWERARPHTG